MPRPRTRVMQTTALASSLARFSDGRRIETSSAMIAITTSSSISVKAF